MEWKNKPVVQEKSSNQSNPNNFALDQVRPEALIKQELSSNHDLQGQIAMVGDTIHQTSSATTNNKIPTDNSSAEIMSHHHLQEDMSMVGEQNHTTKSATTDNRIPTDNSSATITDTTKLRNHHVVTSSVVENDSMNNNLSDSHSHNEWFTNTSLAMGNSSLSASQKNQSTVKPYTAADYLQTLYPQLSVFKAPFEIDEKSPSSAKTFLKSSLVAQHSAPLLPSHGTLGKNSSSPLIKLVLKDNTTNKLSPEMQRKVQKALFMSLLRSSSNLGQRSVVKQSISAPRYISSTSNLLLTRSKKTGKQTPGYRYLTDAGAKLLPAHIFSPLGSVFKDPLGLSQAPLKTSSSTPAPTTPGTRHKAKTDPSIEPTQIGLIQPQTKINEEKEPTSPPAIVPTQSGMIPVAPTTASPYVPTQSGFIASPSDPVEAIVPTRKPFVPTESGLIPSNTKRYGHHEARNKPKTAFVEQRLSSHKTQLTFDDRQEPGTPHLPAKSGPGNEKNAMKARVYNSRIRDLYRAHSRPRRQMFVPLPLVQANDNSPQQFGQSFIPLAGQLPDQSLLSNLQQLQQPVQQFLPTQPLQSLLSQFVPAPQVIDPLQLFGQSGKMVLEFQFKALIKRTRN